MSCRSGEVFKADGEIVVSMARSGSSSSSSSTHPYALLVGQPAAISAAAQQPTAAASTVQTANSAAAAKAAQREVNQLQTQLTAAQQRAAATDSQLRATRSALLHHQQQQAAAEKLLQRLIQQQQADAARAAQVLPGLQQQLTAAQQEQQHAHQALAAAAAAVEHAVEDQLRLLQQLQALTGVSSNLGSNGSRRGCKGTRSTCANINLNHAAVSAVEASLGMLTLSKAAEALAAAEAAVVEVWQRADRAKEQQRRAGSRAAALRKELDKMLKSAGKGIEVEKLQVSVGLVWLSYLSCSIMMLHYTLWFWMFLIAVFRQRAVRANEAVDACNTKVTKHLFSVFHVYTCANVQRDSFTVHPRSKQRIIATNLQTRNSLAHEPWRETKLPRMCAQQYC